MHKKLSAQQTVWIFLYQQLRSSPSALTQTQRLIQPNKPYSFIDYHNTAPIMLYLFQWNTKERRKKISHNYGRRLSPPPPAWVWATWWWWPLLYVQRPPLDLWWPPTSRGHWLSEPKLPLLDVVSKVFQCFLLRGKFASTKVREGISDSIRVNAHPYLWGRWGRYGPRKWSLMFPNCSLSSSPTHMTIILNKGFFPQPEMMPPGNHGTNKSQSKKLN